MRIGLLDVDGHNFPNVALMKIADWHRLRGDDVEWAMPMFGDYGEFMALPADMFPQLTYKDEPVEVEIIIKAKED